MMMKRIHRTNLPAHTRTQMNALKIKRIIYNNNNKRTRKRKFNTHTHTHTQYTIHNTLYINNKTVRKELYSIFFSLPVESWTLSRWKLLLLLLFRYLLLVRFSYSSVLLHVVSVYFYLPSSSCHSHCTGLTLVFLFIFCCCFCCSVDVKWESWEKKLPFAPLNSKWIELNWNESKLNRGNWNMPLKGISF